MLRFAFLLATWFGAGLLPKAPGTWGSLAAVPIAALLYLWGGNLAVATAALVAFLAGIWASAVYVRETGTEDPGAVVIDEVAGQWLVLAAVPFDPLLYGAGFVLFRLFDIAKPWPVSWADRHVKGGLGVMLDDMLAGVYGGVALYLLHRGMESYL